MTDQRSLTTDHAASSYGVPVLVIDQTGYGPMDIVDGTTAASIVRIWLAARPRTTAQQDFCAPFLRHVRGTLSDQLRLLLDRHMQIHDLRGYQVAEAIDGIGPSQLSYWLSSKRDLSAKSLDNVAAYLGVRLVV